MPRTSEGNPNLVVTLGWWVLGSAGGWIGSRPRSGAHKPWGRGSRGEGPSACRSGSSQMPPFHPVFPSSGCRCLLLLQLPKTRLRRGASLAALQGRQLWRRATQRWWTSCARPLASCSATEVGRSRWHRGHVLPWDSLSAVAPEEGSFELERRSVVFRMQGNREAGRGRAHLGCRWTKGE